MDPLLLISGASLATLVAALVALAVSRLRSRPVSDRLLSDAKRIVAKAERADRITDRVEWLTSAVERLEARVDKLEGLPEKHPTHWRSLK